MASFLSEEEVLGREGALWGDSEGQGCTSQHSPCCGCQSRSPGLLELVPTAGMGDGKGSVLLFQDVIQTGIINHVTSLPQAGVRDNALG